MMLQIGYFSSAAGPQDANIVHGILVEARKANCQHSITGLLVAGGGRYLQIIEGPNLAIGALYNNILLDRRHFAVATFLKCDIVERSFGSWSMAFQRPDQIGKLNSFNYVLQQMTADIADSAVKNQVRHFVESMIVGKRRQISTPSSLRAA